MFFDIDLPSPSLREQLIEWVESLPECAQVFMALRHEHGLNDYEIAAVLAQSNFIKGPVACH